MIALSHLTILRRPVRVVARGAALRHLGAVGLPLALYTLIALALFPSVVAHLGSAFAADLGDPPSQAWILAWDLHALTTHPATLFDGPIFYPFRDVLAYQDTLLGLVPLAAPLLWISGSAVLTYNLLFLLTFALCAWGAYLLARHLTGNSSAAFLAGLVYGFSPYRMVHLSHLNLLCGMWIPFALLCWERVRGGERRYWVGVGLFFVLQALSALYYAVFLVVALALLIGRQWWQVRRGVLPSTHLRWRDAALTALGSAVVLLPVVLPYLRVERALGASRGLAQTIYFAADLRDFLHSSALSLLYGWSGATLGVGAQTAMQYLWPGLTTLALAGYGWRAAHAVDRAARRRDYALLGGAAALLCLGPFLKVWGTLTALPLPYLLLEGLPGLGGLRDPARFGALYTLCLALLAAYGAAAIGRRVGGGPGRLMLGALCVAVLAESWLAPLPVAPVPTGAAVPSVYRWLAVQHNGGAVLELPIGLEDKTVWAEQAVMMYDETVHWHPIVNGTGGFAPPGYIHDLPIYRAFPSPATLRLLHARRVRYVVVHRRWVGLSAAAAIAQRAAHTTGVRVLAHWPDADLYAVDR